MPKLYRTQASHHQAGAWQADQPPSKITKPETPQAKTTPGPTRLEVEKAILEFQGARQKKGFDEVAWVDFLDTLFSYLKQPVFQVHMSPLIRARVSVEYELDLCQQRGHATRELEQLVYELLNQIDYKMAQLRTKPHLGLEEPNLIAAKDFSWPLSFGLITSRFGFRKDPIIPQKTQFHNGVDLAAPPNEPIYAVAKGTVVFSGWNGNAGMMVRLRHPEQETETVYAHLSIILVTPGQSVERGEVLGLLGRTGRSTGHHLHFSMIQKGKYVDPLDKLPPIPLGFSDTVKGVAFGQID